MFSHAKDIIGRTFREIEGNLNLLFGNLTQIQRELYCLEADIRNVIKSGIIDDIFCSKLNEVLLNADIKEKHYYNATIPQMLEGLNWHLDNGTFRHEDEDKQKYVRDVINAFFARFSNKSNQDFNLSITPLQNQVSLNQNSFPNRTSNIEVGLATEQEVHKAYSIFLNLSIPDDRKPLTEINSNDLNQNNGFLRTSYTYKEFVNFQKKNCLYIAKTTDGKIVGFCVACDVQNKALFLLDEKALRFMSFQERTSTLLRFKRDTGWHEAERLFFEEGAYYIGILGVDPQFTKQGVGRSLVNNVGGGNVSLITTVSLSPISNGPSLKFFEKVGFVKGGRLWITSRPIEVVTTTSDSSNLLPENFEDQKVGIGMILNFGSQLLLRRARN
jgi:ribosomal protein S18 acetylase RimI-like enzyme